MDLGTNINYSGRGSLAQQVGQVEGTETVNSQHNLNALFIYFQVVRQDEPCISGFPHSSKERINFIHFSILSQLL